MADHRAAMLPVETTSMTAMSLRVPEDRRPSTCGFAGATASLMPDQHFMRRAKGRQDSRRIGFSGVSFGYVCLVDLLPAQTCCSRRFRVARAV